MIHEQETIKAIHALGVFPYEGKNAEFPYFTGWKDLAEPFAGMSTGQSGIVGQLVWWVKLDHPRKAIYVNLPGMGFGLVDEGGILSIGTERLNPDISSEALWQLLRDGVAKLYWLRDQVETWFERWRAEERVSQYRRENLYWRLWGLPTEVAEKIAEQVWEVQTPDFDRSYHRKPIQFQGFHPAEKERLACR